MLQVVVVTPDFSLTAVLFPVRSAASPCCGFTPLYAELAVRNPQSQTLPQALSMGIRSLRIPFLVEIGLAK